MQKQTQQGVNAITRQKQ